MLILHYDSRNLLFIYIHGWVGMMEFCLKYILYHFLFPTTLSYFEPEVTNTDTVPGSIVVQQMAFGGKKVAPKRLPASNAEVRNMTIAASLENASPISFS